MKKTIAGVLVSGLMVVGSTGSAFAWNEKPMKKHPKRHHHARVVRANRTQCTQLQNQNARFGANILTQLVQIQCSLNNNRVLNNFGNNNLSNNSFG